MMLSFVISTPHFSWTFFWQQCIHETSIRFDIYLPYCSAPRKYQVVLCPYHHSKQRNLYPASYSFPYPTTKDSRLLVSNKLQDIGKKDSCSNIHTMTTSSLVIDKHL